jgi:hypothetical protein
MGYLSERLCASVSAALRLVCDTAPEAAEAALHRRLVSSPATTIPKLDSSPAAATVPAWRRSLSGGGNRSTGFANSGCAPVARRVEQGGALSCAVQRGPAFFAAMLRSVF